MTDKITIEQIIDGWQTATFGWQDHPDHAIAMRNYDAARNAHDAEFLRRLRAALAAQPAEPCMDTVLRNAARRSATIVDRGRMVKPVEPVACGAPAVGGLCVLPLGHNRGKADVPANHSAATPAAKPVTCPHGCTTQEEHDAHYAAPAAVPPGWKLVPIKPTPAMIASGAITLVKASHSDIDPTMEEVTAAYHAMIAAAGEPSHD